MAALQAAMSRLSLMTPTRRRHPKKLSVRAVEVFLAKDGEKKRYDAFWQRWLLITVGVSW